MTFPHVPGDPSFAYFLDDKHYTTQLDDSVLINLVVDFYVLGTRPSSVCSIRSIPTAENCLQSPDWRLRQWIIECGRCNCPISAPVIFYDLFQKAQSRPQDNLEIVLLLACNEKS